MSRLNIALIFALGSYFSLAEAVQEVRKINCLKPGQQNTDHSIVILQSQEGRCYSLDADLAQESKTIRDGLADFSRQNAIPLPAVSLQALTRLFTIMRDERVHGKVDASGKAEKGRLDAIKERLSPLKSNVNEFRDLMSAANYLIMKDSLDVSTEIYAQQIFGSALEEIVEMSPEQFAAFEKENLLPLQKDVRALVVAAGIRRLPYKALDRIFPDGHLDPTDGDRDRRRELAPIKVPLNVARIVANVDKHNVSSLSSFPKTGWMIGLRGSPLKEELEKSGWADKILFGDFDFKPWPNRCPLPGLPHYQEDNGSRPDVRYADHGDGTVTDLCTGLTWEKIPDVDVINWEGAEKHCANLVKANANDWHLPTMVELASLIDKTRVGPPTWNHVFEGGFDYYWSSTRNARNIYRMWVVNFNNGSAYSSDVIGGNRVRCVR
jgi:hypothetical protein